MPIRKTLFTLIVVSGSSVLSGRTVVAQENSPASHHHRNNCRLAAQVLVTGHPAPHYAWATEAISRCREEGGPALAAVWARPPGDSAALELVYFASYRLRDARITEAAISVAKDRGSPQLVRLNAIRVLTSHAEPGFLLYSLGMLTPEENDSVRVALGAVSHVSVVDGAHRIAATTQERIVTTLAELRSDADPRIARAASYVLRQLCRKRTC